MSLDTLTQLQPLDVNSSPEDTNLQLHHFNITQPTFNSSISCDRITIASCCRRRDKSSADQVAPPTRTYTGQGSADCRFRSADCLPLSEAAAAVACLCPSADSYLDLLGGFSERREEDEEEEPWPGQVCEITKMTAKEVLDSRSSTPRRSPKSTTSSSNGSFSSLPSPSDSPIITNVISRTTAELQESKPSSLTTSANFATTVLPMTSALKQPRIDFNDEDIASAATAGFDHNLLLTNRQQTAVLEQHHQLTKPRGSLPPTAGPIQSNQGVYRETNPSAKAHALRGLKRYKILSLIGDGTYGLVYLATNVETCEKVAIKSMKRRYHSWDEVTDLREVKSLKKLNHPNVVKLKEVIRENSRLYFIFEYVRGDLLGLMREKPNDNFPEFWIRSVIQQVLQGLSFMHKLGFFHRDLKPENILATTSSADVIVKIADFGLAREIRSAPPFTDYVSTRWYRAPEVLLRSTSYNSPIDIWAVGCITSELYTKRPLFPGTSEIDQLYKIASILGTPGRNDWPEGYSLANSMNFRFPAFKPTHLTSILGPRSSARAVSFLYALLAWNPSWRSSAQEALRHSYFRMGSKTAASSNSPNKNQASATGADPSNSNPMGNTCMVQMEPEPPLHLSLNLRPRNHFSANQQPSISDNMVDKDLASSQQQKPSNLSRLPLPITEIEPHYSRDSYLSRQQSRKKMDGDKEAAAIAKANDPFDTFHVDDDDDDEDFADLISAISLGGGLDRSPPSSLKKQKHVKGRRNVRRNSKSYNNLVANNGVEGSPVFVGAGPTLKEKLPKYSNMDSSPEETSPRRFSVHRKQRLQKFSPKSNCCDDTSNVLEKLNSLRLHGFSPVNSFKAASKKASPGRTIALKTEDYKQQQVVPNKSWKRSRVNRVGGGPMGPSDKCSKLLLSPTAVNLGGPPTKQISPFRSLPDFSVTIASVGGGSKDYKTVQKARRINQQMRSKEMMQQTGLESTCTPLGVDFLNATSSKPVNLHAAEKKVHVRTDWAAKYLQK